MSGREWAVSGLLVVGLLFVLMETFVVVAAFETNDEIAVEIERARELYDAGDIEGTMDQYLAILDRVPDSALVLRSAACLAPRADRGELVPLLLSDLFLTGWDYRAVPLGCPGEEDLYLALFGVWETEFAFVIYRVPDAEDPVSQLLAMRAQGVADQRPEDQLDRRAQVEEVLIIAACINERHGLELAAAVQRQIAGTFGGPSSTFSLDESCESQVDIP